MLRLRSTSYALFLPALVLLAAFATACAGSADQAIVQKYFTASRLRDNTTLANIATVSFDPNKEGIVQSFDISHAGQEQRQKLRIRELSKAYEDARAADDEFTKRKKEYQDKNLEAIERVLQAERRGAKLSGRDAEVQAAWTKWRDETAQISKKVTEARQALSAERGVVEVSVYDARNPVDVTQYDGELISKEVTVAARIRMPDGQVTDKTLVITIQRAEMKSAEGRELTGRWIVTDLKG